ncbi:MAG TPA: NUDIX hydrolase [Ancylobacter sp.]
MNRVSLWVKLIEREVEFAPGAAPEIYHSVSTSDHVCVLAVTPDGRIPLVRQYRPALEGFTLELPAGMIDKDEAPAMTAGRELLEETGFPAIKVHALGVHSTDSGRLGSRTHSYFAETAGRMRGFEPEAGVVPQLVSPAELLDLVFSGEFSVQAQLGTLFLAVQRGHLKLPNRAR